jgi:Ca-activated chloride channel family protein
MPAPMLRAQERMAGGYVPPVVVATDPGRERYDGKAVSPVHIARAEPVSTFSVDVDTGAYANTRRFLSQGQLPPVDAVRSEELINYFAPTMPCRKPRRVPRDHRRGRYPWNLARLRYRPARADLPRAAPPANLVFLR